MKLPRTLEPEVMDSEGDANTYDSMDHTAVNSLFVDDLAAFCCPAGEIFDLGTGTARIPIEICRRYEDVVVVAVDLAISMLDVARINLEIAGLTDRIMLDRVDAKSIEYADNRFAMVVSNSLIHHLPDPSICLAESLRLTAVDGHLFFRDLMRPASGAEVDHLVATYAGEESEQAQQLFYDSLHAALSLDEIRTLVSSLGFDARSVTATSDRHWTWAAQKTNDGPAVAT